jgi:FtsP/CotA-like multicopper oxidase with cupredoxin domain
VRRNLIKYAVNAQADGRSCPAVDPPLPQGGVCLKQKNSTDGSVGFKAYFSEPPSLNSCAACGSEVLVGEEFSSEKNGGRTDIVTAMPGQVTTIRAKFDRLGTYVWHCHIISHEDHEMMRKFEVVA